MNRLRLLRRQQKLSWNKIRNSIVPKGEDPAMGSLFVFCLRKEKCNEQNKLKRNVR